MLTRMGTFAALMLATPIWGMSLSIDASLAAGPSVAPIVAESGEAAEEQPAEEPGPNTSPSNAAELMQRRGSVGRIHRVMGITTWASMTLTVALGWLQYWNLYGGALEDTRCVQGNAFFGQRACVRQPLPHMVSSIATTALYATTFGLTLGMPDPLHLSDGDSSHARNLRRHKRLRWVHFGGMIAQLLLGAVIANGDTFGLSRANDYGTLKALSTVHLAIGMVTYGTMTWAGLIFL